MVYDVVIIGGGFGGLVCGSMLSQAGKHVLVLERQAQAGGCIQSYRHGSLSFDTGLHYVGGLAEGQKLRQVFDHLGLSRLPWHHLDADGFDMVTIGNDTFPLSEGYNHFIDTLSDYFPNERKGLQQYTDMLRHVDDIYYGSSEALKMMGINAYDYLYTTLHDPLLVNVLSGSAMKMELRRESLPLFTFAHGNSSYIQSSWRLRGHGNMIVKVLTDNIRANGGEVLCHSEVEELVEKEGKIRAAKCKNGESFEGQLFISDVHPTVTLALVKESLMLKKVFRKRMENLENTFGMFTVSLVLKPKVLRYFNHNKYVYRKPNVWTFHEESNGVGGVMISARVPETGDYVQQIDLLTPMPWSWCQRWENTRLGNRGDEYLAMKNHLCDECVSLAETVIPGLSTMVSECLTSTSLTYRDYNNAPQGTAFGVRKDNSNPLMTMLSTRTPIPNLLLTGQNLMLHGLEGVAMTAISTCMEILGADYLRIIIKDMDSKKQFKFS
ncbi:MAG: NAD(P)/FAD-dependent oxidoreductase [Prevotella sp.]|nr:NAD(P)/FAD-dependent oxidoreductase [Prevotella sp.]